MSRKQKDEDVVVSVRLPPALLKRVDEAMDRIKAESGFDVSRSDAIRNLLLRALDEET